MSWIGYIDNMKSGGAEHCGIYLQGSGQVCGESGLQLPPAEVQAIQRCRDNLGGDITIDGHKCVLVNVSSNSVQAKTKEELVSPSGKNKYFYHCEFSETMIVVAGMSGASERKACVIAEGIATHLKNSKY